MASLLLAVIYVAFISLGLPDSLLGSAWPTMSQDLNVPVAWAGGISAVISMFTIVSALLSDRMTLKFGAGKVTAVSVALTAAALAGFSVTSNYWVLLAIAIPYGLGAGGVDAALNNYVAIHYESRHMSWLHCMWGVGASVGPYIMGYALSQGQGWPWGYRYIAILQVMLTVILVLSLPLWKKRGAIAVGESTDDTASSDGNAERFGTAEGVSVAERKPLGVAGVLAIRGAKEILVMFFCYCAVESTAGLWASSYMVMHSGIDKITAASWASLFYVGITVGRALSGFLTMRFKDPVMIASAKCWCSPASSPCSCHCLTTLAWSLGWWSSASGARRFIRASSTRRRPTSAETNRRPSSACRWPAPMWAHCSCRHCSASSRNMRQSVSTRGICWCSWC